MEKATKILSKIAAIFMIIFGAFGILNTILFVAIDDAFAVLPAIISVAMLVVGILFAGAAKGTGSVKLVVIAGIAFVVFIVFAVVPFGLLNVPSFCAYFFGLMSVQFFAIMATVFTYLSYVLIAVVAAAVALSIVCLVKSKKA